MCGLNPQYIQPLVLLHFPALQSLLVVIRSPVLHRHFAESKDFKAAWHSLECVCASGVWINSIFSINPRGRAKVHHAFPRRRSSC